MDLEYKMKGALASSKPPVVRVEFDPPLLGYEEVKPRLLGMKADADEALGTVRDENPFASLPQLIIRYTVLYRSRLRRSRISSCRSRSGPPRPSCFSLSTPRACRRVQMTDSGGWRTLCVPGSFRIGFFLLSGRSFLSYTRVRVSMQPLSRASITCRGISQ